MAILIDQPRWEWHGVLWSHLVSDVSTEELHDFARSIGARYLSFQGDHYDLPEPLFDTAVNAGAEVVDSREIVRRLRESGLRQRTGKSETSWTSTAEGPLDKVVVLLEPEREQTARRVFSEVAAVGAVTLLERPNEQVLLLRLSDSAQRLPAGVSVINDDCGLVEADDPRGHSIEIVWRLGAGRELGHR